MQKKLLVSIFAYGFIALMLSAGVVTGKASDTVEGYEENEFLAGLDLWINQSASAPVQSFAPSQSGVEAQVGWELAHYMLLPASVDLSTWTILDHTTIFKVGAFGGLTRQQQEANGFDISLYAGEEKTETGLTSFQGRDVSDEANVDVNDVLANADDTSAPITNFQYDGFNTANGFDTADYKQNYTVPENNAQVGVNYVATDGKTFWEYAEDTADEEGRTLNSIVNGSIVNYIMDGAENDVEGVAWAFEEESTTTSPDQLDLNSIGGSVVKRAQVYIKSAKDVSGRTYSGAKKTVVDSNLFKSVSKAGSGLAGFPSKATQFVTKTIPSGFQKVGNVVIGAFTGGVKNMGIALLVIGIIIVLAILVMNYRKGKGFKLR